MTHKRTWWERTIPFWYVLTLAAFIPYGLVRYGLTAKEFEPQGE